MNQSATLRVLFYASATLLLTVILAWQRETRAVKPVALTPTLTGQVEYCLTCHADLPQISASHPVESFGCVLCHGGERLALEADLAHSSLRGGKNPSDLSVAAFSCGGTACHSGEAAAGRDHIQRVLTSIQGTYTGAITSVRYTFGAQADLTPQFGAYAVTDVTLPSQTGILSLAAFIPGNETRQAVQNFGAACLFCHLSAQPLEGSSDGHANPYNRFTGCAACHTRMQPSASGENWGAGQVHNLTIAMTYTQCNTCHNRGNPDLRSMTFVERTDQALTRQQDYYQPIAQFTRCEYTLDCVDCHTRSEAMGDGDLHASEADAQTIQCKTCHGTLTALPLTHALADPEELAFRLAFLNPVVELHLGDRILVTEQGEPLWNIRAMPDGSYELIGKATRQKFIFRPVMGSGCQQDPARQDSPACHVCHALEEVNYE